MSDIDILPLARLIKGELYTDDLHKILYATDASVYRELPLGVAIPRDTEDIIQIVKYCHNKRIPIIPRAGGTSLAGQCVGIGLVVDVSKYMNKVINIDTDNKTVTVQPGIIRDELNHILKPYKLMIGPNTSTANRATLGGMVGNNSCGSTSIVFGNTRDHVKSLQTILSDGSLVSFGPSTQKEIQSKCDLDSLEGNIYKFISGLIQDTELQAEIDKHYPKPSVSRRNTGYAIDELISKMHDNKINVCNLLCGSEGTLAITTEITIGLVDNPPECEILIAIHFSSVDASLRATPLIMQHFPFACELMDKTILDCTKGQRMYEPDRFFLDGDPAAVMLVSFRRETISQAQSEVDRLILSLKTEQHGYTYPIITNKIDRVWNLRKAGLGLLANLPGDRKAVACIEDTAVAVEDLSAYIREFTEIMENYGQKSVYYAHAGAGEIHLRPILDLKQEHDRKLFHDISLASARLVKKYNGSLSGEHGDGRVRAPFIKEMFGDCIYAEFQKLKSVWDPHHIFNPGKIVDALPMNEYLRFDHNHEENSYNTTFDFDAMGGVLRAAEKCNGSGDCRKLPLSGGTMCPSYMATRNEKDTTRARANTLREVLTRPKGKNAWDNKELKEVMDLCLSCKGCTTECPSNVDMSTMKAEFLHQYQKEHGIPLRSKIFANYNKLSKMGSRFGALANWAMNSGLTSGLLKTVIGINSKRSLPTITSHPLKGRFGKIVKEYENIPKIKKVYFFCDEFTNYNDAEIGERALRLLLTLGYKVMMVEHAESGRAAISNGVLDIAVEVANKNVAIFENLITKDAPLIGIEPSAILTFRDEYPKLVKPQLVSNAKILAKNCLTIEEFLYSEVKKGVIDAEAFDSTERQILLHGHCHQKALTDINEVAWLLSVPSNHTVEIIPSGCCGMAGSFGYEKEHYEISMDIGELVLFPAIRKAKSNTHIVASGTSCRHQILDGTGDSAKHVVELLWDCLLK
ncbi:MAG: FAD/FMN-containing dehydrogenase/Fe-S oxidoreductase [Saprospiraceae bacterium]|jgi:FAD/FMN-containing dehydrogenase/Fe-S oxidoreductase